MHVLPILAATAVALPIVIAQSCTIRNGQVGECISTNSCSSEGGKFEAGHCPGSSDIQVKSIIVPHRPV